jgi:hypothetical protein
MPPPLVREVKQNPDRKGIQDPRPGITARRHAEWDNDLCRRCNGIQLDSLLDEVECGVHRLTEHSGLLISDLGHYNTWSKTCSLCNVFRHAALRDTTGPGYYVLRLITRRLCDREFLTVTRPLIRELEMPLLAVTTDEEKDDCHTGDLSFGLGKTGYISWKTSPESAAPPSRGKVIDRQNADFNQISTWLSFCQNHHMQLCLIPAGDPVPGFQLIDCQAENKIITATRNMKYIALSYVWGADVSVDALENGKLIYSGLPQTVRDAIGVTKRLGFRYLWVDRYCIPTDPQIKHSQISKMDIIYKQAQATLLGAAGNGAAFGLPGSGTRERDEQPTAAIREYKVFATLQPPKVAIGRSVWNTRGWTYQEAMLSTRRIFFTEEQVYWECRSMQCTEALPPTLSDWHKPSRQMYYEDAQHEMFSLSTVDLTLRDVWKYIMAYSRRKLSFDDDSLNAFLGVLGFLQAPQTMLRHFWGIPIPMRADQDTIFGTWQPIHCFLTALTWIHREECRRRPNFPSWSWVGWECDLAADGMCYSYQGCSCDLDLSDTARVLGAWTSDGKFLSWDTIQLRLADRDIPPASLPRVIVIQAWTVQLKVKLMLRGHIVQNSGYYVYNHVGVANARNMVLEDCVIYKKIELSDNSDLLRRRLVKESFTGVLLGCHRKTREANVLLLDHRADGVYERIGTVKIKSLPVFNGIIARVTGAVSLLGGGGGRTSTDSSAVEIEDWKLTKSWQTLRIG